MKYLIFRNKGIIDTNAITTLGVSSKDNENAIGFFGTGLKYSIAIVLREGCEITIHAGTTTYKFGTIRTKIRNDEFDIVTMNRKQLGFTTDFGKTWEVWQAFRELYCNTMDEGGTISISNTLPIKEEGVTTIVVTGKQFIDAFHNRSEVILDTPPLFTSTFGAIHAGLSNHVYYRGIKALKLLNISKYTYNITSKLDLTEDRTIKHTYEAINRIAHTISSCGDSEILTNVLMNTEGTLEDSLDYEYHGSNNQKFVDFCLANRTNVDVSLMSNIFKMLGKRTDIIGLYDEVTLNKIEERMLEKSITFCNTINYDIAKYNIVIVESLGDNILGLAKDNTIYLARRAFMMGTKMVAGTLLEEYLHLEYRLRDESRKMQNYLFDLVISLGERLQGEPL